VIKSTIQKAEKADPQRVVTQIRNWVELSPEYPVIEKVQLVR
jgi:hypothetical protein